METRDVYVFLHLDGDWIPAGLLRMRAEGAAVVASTFRYGARYLRRPDALAIDLHALPLRDEAFSTEPAFDVFTGIKDALPDAWGRAVMERRAGRPLREDEILLASPDTRVGALGFGATLDGPQRELPWPPALEARDRVDLVTAVGAYADYSADDHARLDEALRRLVLPGSSLGGARPKATVVIDDELWIAKLSRSNDAFDYTRAEYATMRLAARCGIDVPPVEHRRVAGRSAFLVRRFDREGPRRTHFNSMLTVLGETELSFFHSSYMDMADACVRHLREHEPARRALFRRMVFNGLCNNDDDHLRNHAVIWSPAVSAFVLSPAYDLVANPAVAAPRRLSIGCGVDAAGRVTRSFSVESAVRAAPRFGLGPEEARAIVAEVRAGLAGWAEVFEATGMRPDDVRVFAPAFEGP